MTISREYQREIGRLLLGTSSAIEAGTSTMPGTIHASADTMEWLALEGGALLRDYSAKERRRMAREGRAMGDGSFPIGTCEDAELAIHAQGRADPVMRKDVDAFIRRRVTALRCEGAIFDAYRD